jgi:hypothetical protein
VHSPPSAPPGTDEPTFSGSGAQAPNYPLFRLLTRVDANVPQRSRTAQRLSRTRSISLKQPRLPDHSRPNSRRQRVSAIPHAAPFPFPYHRHRYSASPPRPKACRSRSGPKTIRTSTPGRRRSEPSTRRQPHARRASCAAQICVASRLSTTPDAPLSRAAFVEATRAVATVSSEPHCADVEALLARLDGQLGADTAAWSVSPDDRLRGAVQSSL